MERLGREGHCCWVSSNLQSLNILSLLKVQLIVVDVEEGILR